MLDPPQSDISTFMTNEEKNSAILEHDLKHLAAYLIKIGTDVNIVLDKSKQHRLLKHPELNLLLLQRLVQKYKLSYKHNCEKQNFGQSNRSLSHIAFNYPSVFIERAATLSPGSYDERRFWWCANNYEFYTKHSDIMDLVKAKKAPISYSSSRLLSDVLCHVLTFDEPKLIAINALHLSVKHSDSQVFVVWFERNRNLIHEQIKKNLSISEMKLKSDLRKKYRIKATEAELNTVHVDLFVEWWNLTGLRR